MWKPLLGSLCLVLVSCQGATPTEPAGPESEPLAAASAAPSANGASAEPEAAGVTFAAVKGGAGKVEVCHRPPGNPENARIIVVGESAVTAHLAHGDHEVAAEVCDDGIDNDCDGAVDGEDADDCACPLSLEALPFWYQTTPPIAGLATIQFSAIFENNDPLGRDYDMNGFQIWTLPSVDAPATIVNLEPVFVPFGGTGSYDLTVDLSAHPGETGIAFRPISNQVGTMSPELFSLVSATFDCF